MTATRENRTIDGMGVAPAVDARARIAAADASTRHAAERVTKLSAGHIADPTAEADALLAAYNDALSRLQEITEQANRLDFERAAVLAELSELSDRIATADDHRDQGALMHRSTEAEVALITRTGQLAAAHRIAHASTLIAHYSATAAALKLGALSLAHTEVIVQAGQIISMPFARAQFEAESLKLACEMTANQLKPHAKRLAEIYADRDIDERYEDARRQREVRITSLDDGMARLTATLGAVEAFAIKDRLTRISHHVHKELRRTSAEPNAEHEGDTRTTRHIQADVFVELLLTAGSSKQATAVAGTASHTYATGTAAPGGDPLAAVAGRVQISVPVLTLARSTHPEAVPHISPAELAGYGPIGRKEAMKLAGNAPSWARVMTHPISGAVLAVDRYQPSEDLKRLLGARDQHCRFPGCTRRLDHCDIDHTTPYSEGGRSSAENLGYLCRRHHVLKHWRFLNDSGWRVTQSGPGIYTWHAPSSRRYRDAPKSSVRFRPHKPPENEPPPSF